MIILILFLIMMIGAVFMQLPSIFGLPMLQNYATIIGSAIMFISFIILVVRAAQTSAIYLIENADPRKVLLLHMYKDGRSRFVPAWRLPQGYLYSVYGTYKDTGGIPIRIAGHDVRPVLSNVAHVINPKLSEYVRRLRQKYGVESFAEARALAEKVQEEQEETGKPLSEDRIKKIAMGLGMSDIIRNKYDLQERIEKNPIHGGVLEEKIAGETVDFLAYEKFQLNQASPKDFETIQKWERQQAYLEKRHMSKLSISPTWVKLILVIIVMLPIGIYLAIMLLGGHFSLPFVGGK